MMFKFSIWNELQTTDTYFSFCIVLQKMLWILQLYEVVASDVYIKQLQILGA